MKFAYKIFCVTYIIVMLATGIGGFLLLEVTTSNISTNRVDRVLTSNIYATKLFTMHFDTYTDFDNRINEIQKSIFKICNLGTTESISIYRSNDVQSAFSDVEFVSKLKSSQQGYSYINNDSEHKLICVSRVDHGNKSYYIATVSDFSDIFSQKAYFVSVYKYTVIGVALFAGIVLFTFSVRLSTPLKKLSKMAGEISNGNYDIRIANDKQIKSSAEIKKLANDFNNMAKAIEQNIHDLNEEMEKRDVFVADFTHELKTPMTSIIGYSDMLRTYNLSPAETRDIADTIYRESKRLQTLSMRLLDIIVMKNQESKLSNVTAKELFNDYYKSVYFLTKKYDVDVEVQFNNAELLCEKELMLSLMYNLTDNSLKASHKGDRIIVKGRKSANGYLISVQDFGKGIDKDNIKKITEPFFMEDKSRSRKQGGAGLGLSLCRQIAEIHGTTLNIQSEKGKGTTVSVVLKTTEGKGDNDE